MPRIFVSVVCATWTLAFAFRAAHATGLSGHSLPEPWSMPTAVTVACTLVAALFLWAAISCLGATEEGASDIAATASTAAVITLALIVPAAAADPFTQLPADLGIHLAALCVTWLAVRQAETMAVRPAAEEPSRTRARRLAVGAAHGSMLARLSGRRAGTVTSED